MNAYARSSAHASTSGRPCRAPAPCKRPQPALRRGPACAAAQKETYAPSQKETAEIEAISRGFEARLARLHADAPDDNVLQDMAEATMQWDDDELASEGAALQQSDAAALELPDPTEEDEAAPRKAKVKPAPLPDLNTQRVARGQRLLVTEVPVDALPKVAVVGRPNVGKSALFNRIVGKAAAIVYDTPGVTRDRLYMRAAWGGRDFVLVDTGGLMSSAAQLPAEIAEAAMAEVSAADLPAAIERQAAAGIGEADVVIMVCDGQEGPTASDEEVIAWLRKVHSKRKVVLAVNKCESETKGLEQAAQFWAYGHEPLPVSAISGTGTGELMERLIAALPPPQRLEATTREAPLAVAIIGRPNVGKSSLVNAITGTHRAIVSDLSGTTHDAVDSEVALPDGTPLTLVDTAGIRRRAKVKSSKDGAEPMSVVRAIRALRRTDVAAILLDATAGVSVQDYRIAELAAQEGRAVVVVLNKWDQVEDQSPAAMAKMAADVRAELRAVSWAKIVFTSALHGKNVHKVLHACVRAGEQHARRVSTATLNLVVSDSTLWKSPPTQRGASKRPRIYYATQAAVRPPTFIFFCNDGRLIGDDYRRYLERSLRESIDLEGTPVRIFFRGRAPGKGEDSGGAKGGAAAGVKRTGLGSVRPAAAPRRKVAAKAPAKAGAR